MRELDEIAPAFRRMRDRWPEAATLAAHYGALAENYAGNQHSLIDLVKSFIETVCKTILIDHGRSIPSDAAMTWLVTQTMEELGFKKSKGTDKFDKVLSTHNKLAAAINAARNDEGCIAHGKDGYLDALADNHARVYLLSGDTILTLLLGALSGSSPPLEHTREPYKRFTHLHEKIDSSIQCTGEWDEDAGVLVLQFSSDSLGDLRFEPSEILYALDRSAYVAALAAVVAAEPVPLPKPLQAVQEQSGPNQSQPTTTYSVEMGNLELIEAVLQLIRRTTPTPESDEELRALATELVAVFRVHAVVDWKTREVIRLKMKIAFKRTLHSAGIPQSNELAKQLEIWFGEHYDGVE